MYYSVLESTILYYNVAGLAPFTASAVVSCGILRSLGPGLI